MSASAAQLLSPRRWRARSALGAVIALSLLAGACTSSSDSEGSDATTTTSSTDVPRSAVDGLASLCGTATEDGEVDVAGFALDPSTTGQILSVPDDEVGDASDVLIECLGPDGAGEFVANRTIVTGIPLEADTAECFAGYLEEDNSVLVLTMRRMRLSKMTEEEVEPLVVAMTDCVPANYLGAALQADDPTSYLVATDLSCMNETDDETMRLFWQFQLVQPEPDPSTLTDDELDQLVAPLYNCIETGAYAAAGTGVPLSPSSRDCIGEAARLYGLWESKMGERPFDQDSYERDLESCLTPEEAFAVLGTPIPVDDPELSHFADVDRCWAEQQGDPEATLDATELGADEVLDVADELASCAGPEGAAGRMASMSFGSRALPEGSYECILPHATAAPEDLLAGRLLVEAGIPTSESASFADAGTAYIGAAEDCVPMNMATRGLWADFSLPAISNTIDFACIDEGYATDQAALDAFWQSTVTGTGADSDGQPNEQAATAVAPLYNCVSPGLGFAATAIAQDLVVDEDQVVCIDANVAQSGLLEARLVGTEQPADTFSEAIASCLPDIDEWRAESEEVLGDN